LEHFLIIGFAFLQLVVVEKFIHHHQVRVFSLHQLGSSFQLLPLLLLFQVLLLYVFLFVLEEDVGVFEGVIVSDVGASLAERGVVLCFVEVKRPIQLGRDYWARYPELPLLFFFLLDLVCEDDSIVDLAGVPSVAKEPTTVTLVFPWFLKEPDLRPLSRFHDVRFICYVGRFRVLRSVPIVRRVIHLHWAFLGATLVGMSRAHRRAIESKVLTSWGIILTHAFVAQMEVFLE